MNNLKKSDLKVKDLAGLKSALRTVKEAMVVDHYNRPITDYIDALDHIAEQVDKLRKQD